MKTSNLIWVPSLQRKVRFDDITGVEEQAIIRILAADDEVNAYYHFNVLLETACHEKDILDSLTIIDRFTVLLAMRIIAINNTLTLKNKCEGCGEEVSLPVALDSILHKIAPVVDKKIEFTFPFDNMVIHLEPPTYKRYYNYLLNEAVDSKDDKFVIAKVYENLVLYIKGVTHNDTFVSFIDTKVSDSMIFIDKLPKPVFEKMLKMYMDHINGYKQELFRFSCTKEKCKHESDYFYFNLQTMDQILKLIFSDSMEKFLGSYVTLGKKIGMTSDTVLRLLPWEREFLTKKISDELNKDEGSGKSSPMINPHDEDDLL
jgi:hypothetical protein